MHLLAFSTTSRRVPLRLALSAFALAVTLSATGCATLTMLLHGGFQTPTATLRSASIEGVSLEAVTLAATFDVENPNPVGVKLVGVDWQFAFDGEALLDGALAEPLELRAKGATTVKIPVRVPYKAIPNAVLVFARRPQAPYEVSGTINVDTPLGRRAVPVRWTGEFPRPSLGL